MGICMRRYAVPMNMIVDALWRALADCLRGKVLAWSLFPLVLLAVMAAVVGIFWWDGAVTSVHAWLEQARWLQWLWGSIGTASETASMVVAVVIVVLLVSPILIMIALGVVAVVMTPRMVEVVAQRRFPLLARKRGAGSVASALWALSSTAIALLVFTLSIPLWFVPPMILVLPPLIWGWLTYRVMTFDALAEHASKSERASLLKEHRYRLILMGVICGYAGAAPSLVWASGIVFAAAFWILIPLAVWMYALVLAFSSLWFAHYGLAALYSFRAAQGDQEGVLAP